MNEKERLVKRWGNNSAVPCNINLDFAFELDQETWDGLKEIFNRLADYEDTGLAPYEIAKVAGGNRIAGNAL